MSREILFRARRVDNSEWAEGYFVRDLDIPYIVVPVKSGITDYLEVDLSTVCQYTGLTDQTERKIFDGDILEADLDNDQYDGKPARMLVVWLGYGWGLQDLGLSGFWADPITSDVNTNWKVVGNKWDNSGLLKG